ncbi:MAG TPA: long-chain fatty acid--CoA ligase, partial [Treponemataceae bacterium]|nr:long-chain fatty acid--CoA ligase [Treponemataceae bacterium]
IVTEGGKNVYPEEIENAFQLHYDEIEQITVQGYIKDEATKSEGIEALVYPADELLKKLDLMRGDSTEDDSVTLAIGDIVDGINRSLQPYQRITKVTILSEPLEMTTTRKVKRIYKK